MLCMRRTACLGPCTGQLRRYGHLMCALAHPAWSADPAVLCRATPQRVFLNQSLVSATGTICEANSTAEKVGAIQVGDPGGAETAEHWVLDGVGAQRCSAAGLPSRAKTVLP